MVMVAVLAGCKNGDVVATVNGENIYAKDLDLCTAVARAEIESYGYTEFDSEEGQKELESLRLRTLDEMINNRIVVQEARQLVKLSKDEIKSVLDKLREQSQFETDEEFVKSFDRFYGVTLDDYAHIVTMREKLAEEVPRASEAEARKFYDDNLESYFTKPEEFVTRHVLFLVETGDGAEGRHTIDDAWALAMGVINRLNEGANFAIIAAEESEDQATKQQGGEYRFTDSGSTVPEYLAAVRGLYPGEYTLFPIQTEYGFHVIMLEEVIPTSWVPFEEEKENIISHLTNMAVQNYINEKMMEARERAVIVNKLVPEVETPAATEQQQTPQQPEPTPQQQEEEVIPGEEGTEPWLDETNPEEWPIEQPQEDVPPADVEAEPYVEAEPEPERITIVD